MDKLTHTLLKLPMFGGSKKKMEPMKLKLVRAACVLIMTALSAAAIYMAVNRKEETVVSVYKGSAKATASYDVELKKNNFFETDTLGMNRNYVRSIVKAINIDFDLDMADEGEGTASVQWSVTGKMSTWYVDNSKEKAVWSATDILSYSDMTELSHSDYKLKVPITVDQAAYAAMLKAFQDQLEISANGYYDVTFEAVTKYKVGNKSKTNTARAVVSIPLNGKVFTPVVSEDAEANVTYFNDIVTVPVNTNWVLFGFIVVGVLVFAAALLLACLCCENKKRDEYFAQLKDKISQIEDRLVYVDGVYDWSEFDVSVSDFDSLVHLADERALPILCTRNDKTRKAVFFVTESQQDFYYIFDESKIEVTEEMPDEQETE